MWWWGAGPHRSETRSGLIQGAGTLTAMTAQMLGLDKAAQRLGVHDQTAPKVGEEWHESRLSMAAVARREDRWHVHDLGADLLDVCDDLQDRARS